jgi:hypothetical protein
MTESDLQRAVKYLVNLHGRHGAVERAKARVRELEMRGEGVEADTWQAIVQAVERLGA